MSTDELITHKDAANLIGVTSAAIGRWVKQGLLKQHEKFGRLLLEKKQVEELRAVQRQHPFDWRKHWKVEDSHE